MAVAFDDLEVVADPRGNNLLVVDGLNLAFRWKHASGEVDAGDFLYTIESFAKSYHAGTIIILTDYKRSTYRSGIYPEYKGNRTAKYAEQTEKEKEDFLHFLNTYEAALTWCSKKYPVIKMKGVEADDIAAYLAINYAKNYSHTWLISSDRDWDLLIKDNVSRFSYVTRKEITVDNWEDRYPGIDMDKYIDLKVLEGDKGDNVPGVALIGPVRAKSLIDTYGSVYDLIASLPIDGTAKYIQNLNDSRDQLLLNFELMDLVSYHREAIGNDNIDKIDEIMRGL